MDNTIHNSFRNYFSWFDKKFGNLAREAEINNISPSEIAKDVLSNSKRREGFLTSGMPAVEKFVETFWEENHTRVLEYVQNLPGVQARFGGDIGPQTHNGTIHRAGLYFDTIVVPDPVFRVVRITASATKNREYYLLKYIISQLMQKDFYLADISPPIAILVADSEIESLGQGLEDLTNISQSDATLLSNALFGEDFDSFQDALDFSKGFRSIDEFVSALVRPDLIYFDEDSPRSPDEQILALLDQSNRDINQEIFPIDINSPEYIIFTLNSRMMQANDVFNRSSAHRALPLISAPVSYHWLATKIELNQNALSQHLGLAGVFDLVKTNALLSENLSWLSNIPSNALVQLRQEGKLNNLRSLLSKNFSAISSMNAYEIESTARNVDNNLRSEFQVHQSELNRLDKTFRQDLALAVPSLLSSVTIALKPSILSITPEVLRAAGVIAGTTSVKSIIEKTVAYLRNRNKLKNQPIAVLWEAKKADK